MDDGEIRDLAEGQHQIDAARSKQGEALTPQAARGAKAPRRQVRYKTRGYWSELSNLRRRIDELEKRLVLLDRLNRRFQSQVEWLESSFPKLKERRFQIESEGGFDYLLEHDAPRPVGRPPRSFFEGKV